MGRFSVLVKASAANEIQRIGSKKDRRKIVDRIGFLADDPRPHGCKKLSGRERYRIRQGQYRIVYSVEDSVSVVCVVKVGHRRDVYRGTA